MWLTPVLLLRVALKDQVESYLRWSLARRRKTDGQALQRTEEASPTGGKGTSAVTGAREGERKEERESDGPAEAAFGGKRGRGEG